MTLSFSFTILPLLNGCSKILDWITEALRSFFITKEFNATMASSDAYLLLLLSTIELSCRMNCISFDEQSSDMYQNSGKAFGTSTRQASHVPNKSLCKVPVALMPASL
jgi:hypothetical protein